MRTIRRIRASRHLAVLAALTATGLLGVACNGATGDFMEKAADAVAEPEPEPLTVAGGTGIPVTLQQAVSSGDSRVGDIIEFAVREDVMVGDEVAIPAGSRIEGEVASVQAAERPQKPGQLVLQAHSLHVGGEVVPLNAVVTAKGRGSHEEDARDIGIGAAAGAVLGGILEGGKGVVAGIILGGGGTFLATKGEQVELPAGVHLIVELQAPIDVPSQ